MQDQPPGRHAHGLHRRRSQTWMGTAYQVGSVAWWRWFVPVAHVLIVAAVVAVALGATVVAVGHAVDTHEKVYWGTFTQTRCDETKDGCDSYGTWVSDSGAIVKKDVELDGTPASDGIVRANYTPTGFDNDADNDVVHAGDRTARDVLGPSLFAGGAAVFALYVAVKWGFVRRRRLRKKRDLKI